MDPESGIAAELTGGALDGATAILPFGLNAVEIELFEIPGGPVWRRLVYCRRATGAGDPSFFDFVGYGPAGKGTRDGETQTQA